MSYYYPQACVTLRVLPEDFKLTSDASLQVPYEINVIPRDITVNINDYKTSNTFTCELDYKNFPFDPRSIRYCGVKVYMQDMGSLQNASGGVNKIIPSSKNAVFFGFVDEETISFDDSKRTVKFEGRDFTSLFIDQKYKENVPVTMTQPLDQILKLFLTTFKATQEIKLLDLTGESVLPTLAQFYPDFGSGLAGQKNVGAHESYWEIMQDMVHRAGLICYISLNNLILTTPRNLYSPVSDLKLIYGQNVKSLTMKRKLGRFKGFNIRIRSRSDKTVISADIPAEATPEWCKSFGIARETVTVPVLKPDGTVDPGQSTTPAPLIAFPVPNISNKDQLIRIGQTVFEDYSRQQLEGTLETVEMVGHAGKIIGAKDYKAYDLTQLSIGQPLAIEIATDDLNAISRITNVATRIDYLIKRNYRQDVAAVFAKSMGKFSSRFYTKAYSMTLNQDSGFKLRIEFINIIELSYKGL